MASVSDQGQEVGGMRLGYLGSSVVRCCESGQSLNKYRQPPTCSLERRVAVCADWGQSHWNFQEKSH